MNNRRRAEKRKARDGHRHNTSHILVVYKIQYLNGIILDV